MLAPLKPHRWIIPRDWPGERVFVTCGGASLREADVRRIKGRMIMVKQTALMRLDADVMFFAGRDSMRQCLDIVPRFEGQVIIRGDYPGTEQLKNACGAPALCVSKQKADALGRMRLSADPRCLAGWDSGAAAINLAYLRGGAEIVVLGMDMTGGHWAKNHPAPRVAESAFQRHMRGIEEMSEGLKAAGVKVFNCSPVSRLKCFERRSIDDFL